MQASYKKVLIKGTLDMMPLSLAVLPWGILVGSLAVQQGFAPFEAQLLSLLVFAGSAQLVTIELISQHASLATLCLTIFVISARHFLYGLALRDKLKKLPTKQRLFSAFILTDELFALSTHAKAFTGKLRIWYGFCAGFSFYLAWNLWTFLGIFAGKLLPDLTHLGLDFAVAVTFIALVTPSVTKPSILIAVISAGITSVALELADVELTLIIAAFVGMTLGYLTQPLDLKFSIKQPTPTAKNTAIKEHQC